MSSPQDCAIVLDTTLSGFAIGVVELGTGNLLWDFVTLQQDGTAIIDQAWQQAKLFVTQSKLVMRGVCVAHGPGSFTGIKIGLAFALGLRRAGTPDMFFVTRSSLALIADYFAKDDPKCVGVVLPATRTRGAAAIRHLSDTHFNIVDIDTAALKLAWSGPGNIYLLVPWPMLESRVAEANVPLVVHQLDKEQVLRLSLSCMATSISQKSVMQLQQEAQQPGTLEPFYLRASTAEEAKFGKSSSST